MTNIFELFISELLFSWCTERRFSSTIAKHHNTVYNKYAEKMFLVPQHQLDKLKSENSRGTIRQIVENDLDVSIRNILGRHDLDSH